MGDTSRIPPAAMSHLTWPLRLTRAGMLAERVLRSFWPSASILIAALSALMFGVQDMVPIEVAWSAAVIAVLGFLATLGIGIRQFRWPSASEAMERLDRTLPGRPLSAIGDVQAVGAGDAASRALWKAHVERMAARAADARAPAPDLRLARRDPYALRYVALLAFVMALLFGSIFRVASVTELGPGGGQSIATGPSWEGWVEPPAYTGRPSLYLNDITGRAIEVPQGSRVTVRLYGEVGELTLNETVSGRTEVTSAADPSQDFEVVQPGRLEIAGPGGRSWDIRVIPDTPPTVRPDGEIERGATGEMRQPFAATDDYGVVAGRAVISLDMGALDRRYGLAADPEPREDIVLDLPLSIARSRTDFKETLVEDLSKHPWAGLPVTISLAVEDALGQTGTAEPIQVSLPGRRFFDPLAAALIEQRRDLLWSKQNGTRAAQVLRAVSFKPEGFFRSETAYLMLRVAIRRLETAIEFDQFDDARRDEVADALWDIAVLIEDGRMSDALERLRQAQDRLSEAIRNGANDEEIAQLMDELRQAMQDYMRQLAEEAQQNPDQQQAQNQQGQEITGDMLEQMLQRLQELMEQGRTEEAQALLDQLRQMMENMQVTQGQGGQGQQSPGQQAMEGLAETLRNQQELSDETFGDLQQQFGQQGQGQEGQQGQPRGDGRQGQSGQSQGQSGGDGQMSLAERQRALRNELDRQMQNLPGVGDGARDALDRAGRAMDNAEDSLRNEDFAGALDSQSEALEALREGMRNLGEALAQQQQQQGGQQGEALGDAGDAQRRDPLGRDAGNLGRIGTDEFMLQGEDVYRRARELLDEIRRRSGDQTRPDAELDYLRRLLERF